MLREIQEAYQKGQPVLVGASVEASEALSHVLKGKDYTQRLECQITSRRRDCGARGQKRAVTIATNMAGRGTDIKLGDGVPELGGLFVIGTERHESRRVDRQLRGRCARSDPGMSSFSSLWKTT